MWEAEEAESEWFVSSAEVSCPLTFSLHAHSQALLVAAVLAAVPLSLIDHTVFIVPTGVGQVFAYCSLEEAFAALAAVDTVVFTWRLRGARRLSAMTLVDVYSLQTQRTGVVFKVCSHQRICHRRWNRGVSGKALALGCGTTAASSPAEASHRRSCSLRGAPTWTLWS